MLLPEIRILRRYFMELTSLKEVQEQLMDKGGIPMSTLICF